MATSGSGRSQGLRISRGPSSWDDSRESHGTTRGWKPMALLSMFWWNFRSTLVWPYDTLWVRELIYWNLEVTEEFQKHVVSLLFPYCLILSTSTMMLQRKKWCAFLWKFSFSFTGGATKVLSWWSCRSTHLTVRRKYLGDQQVNTAIKISQRVTLLTRIFSSNMATYKKATRHVLLHRFLWLLPSQNHQLRSLLDVQIDCREQGSSASWNERAQDGWQRRMGFCAFNDSNVPYRRVFTMEMQMFFFASFRYSVVGKKKLHGTPCL